MKPMIIKVCKLLIFADGYGNNIILKILLCQAPRDRFKFCVNVKN